jgi:FdhD protein
MNSPKSKSIQFYQFSAGDWKIAQKQIVVEKPVSLTVNGKTWMDMLCSPAQLDYLGVGFLYNEGLIQNLQDLASVYVCPANDNVDVWTHQRLEKPMDWRKTSGCSGGQTSQDLPELPLPKIKDVQLSPKAINDLLQQFVNAQKTQLESRGIHTSALSDGKEILAIADDVGRHNTLDKLAGYCVLNHVTLPQPVILTTGRISSEMLQKSARMGCSVIISLTSPNNYSIELADQWQITLVGYARLNSFNVYTHAHRITGGEIILSNSPAVNIGPLENL